MTVLERVSRMFEDGALTCAALAWQRKGGAVESRLWSSPVPGPGWFDLASLSKPFTATLALRLDEDGELPLSTPLGSLCGKELPVALREVHLEALLRHRAGLEAWSPMYAREAAWDRSLIPLLATTRDGGAVRRGTYSDLGYMLYAVLAENALGAPLSSLLTQLVLQPMGIGEEVVAAEHATDLETLPCKLSTRREVELAVAMDLTIADLGPPELGEVQDGNARWFGRYCGHAGLFATWRAVLEFAEQWRLALHGQSELISRKTARKALGGTGTRRLGWWRRTLRGAAGPALSRCAFGHTGFVGSSVWVDPLAELSVCLLSHRSQPEVDLQSLRRRVHRWVLR